WPFFRPWPRTSITVIPSTPTSCNALFTASNLEFWMTASTFVMILFSDSHSFCGPSQITYVFLVVFFSSLSRQVQALDRLSFVSTNADRTQNARGHSIV